MNALKYIELDSTYRDRNRFPIASEFEVPVSISGTRGRFNNPYDFVSNAAPSIAWTGVPDHNAVVDANPTPSSFMLKSAQLFETRLNYYSSAKITCVDTGESRYVSYSTTLDDNTLAVFVNTPFASVQVAFTMILHNTSVFVSPQQALVFVPAGTVSDPLSGLLLYNETVNQYTPILQFEETTNLAMVGPAPNAQLDTWTALDSYCIRKEPPLVVAAIGVVNSARRFTLTGAGGYDMSRQYLRVGGASRLIVAYNSLTSEVLLDTDVSPFPTTGERVELLGFSYDNMVPFSYNGNGGFQEDMAYEIGLAGMSIPNLPLKGDLKSTAFAFPYLYVELTPATSRVANTIYSNNPHSARSLFRAESVVVNQPELNHFINFKACGGVQTVKFRLNDTLRFSVKTPDGELLQFEGNERYSPSAPNALLQISAYFSVKKI